MTLSFLPNTITAIAVETDTCISISPMVRVHRNQPQNDIGHCHYESRHLLSYYKGPGEHTETLDPNQRNPNALDPSTLTFTPSS